MQVGFPSGFSTLGEIVSLCDLKHTQSEMRWSNLRLFHTKRGRHIFSDGRPVFKVTNFEHPSRSKWQVNSPTAGIAALPTLRYARTAFKSSERRSVNPNCEPMKQLTLVIVHRRR